ncbi:MAG: hypothetical protein WC796_00005 [Candidatus Pacearchaeota archaeon]|jgi:hypothetical protein
MTRRIHIDENLSLAELEFKSGDVVAFDNSDVDLPQPFVLAVADKIERGFSPGKNCLGLMFNSNGNREEWTLYTRGHALGLWAPSGPRDLYRPSYKVMNGFSGDSSQAYFVESAYSGVKEIERALGENRQGLDAYLEFIYRGRLVMAGSRFRRFAERKGLGNLLPNQIRFRELSDFPHPVTG